MLAMPVEIPSAQESPGLASSTPQAAIAPPIERFFSSSRTLCLWGIGEVVPGDFLRLESYRNITEYL